MVTLKIKGVNPNPGDCIGSELFTITAMSSRSDLSALCSSPVLFPLSTRHYGDEPEPETQFLMALDLCEDFFAISATCTPTDGMQLRHAVELLTPLLAGTELWFVLIDRYTTRIQRLRSQLQTLGGTSQPGQTCCINQHCACPLHCDPSEYAQLLEALLSV